MYWGVVNNLLIKRTVAKHFKYLLLYSENFGHIQGHSSPSGK
jgi:hypothetical protein